MHITVIISTYNRPRDLERVLWGYAMQTDRDFELLVADDGSGDETAAAIRRVAADAGMPVRHVWHEDRGFRKCDILNRAIVASSGDYLLFTDGDCIPRRDMLAIHRELAAPDQFLAGGYLKLPAAASDAITLDDIRSGRFAEGSWLRARGWRPGRRALRLTRSRRLGALFDALTPTKAVFQGNNASVWRDALLAVNGFESDMGYGSEDKAAGYRLENLGVRAKQVRHRAVCLHLDHPRPYRDPMVMGRNRAVLRRIRRTGEVRAHCGIAELRPDPALRVDDVSVSARTPS
jgi:glycosyltransferase involved in cell wall biosynthesis